MQNTCSETHTLSSRSLTEIRSQMENLELTLWKIAETASPNYWTYSKVLNQKAMLQLISVDILDEFAWHWVYILNASRNFYKAEKN